MNSKISWPLSSILLALSGVALMAIGLFFLFLRPSLLPEDLHYIGVSLPQIEAAVPRLLLWLPHVFRVLGGFALATGILTITLALTSFRARQLGAVVGASVAGVASIGLMAIINVIIDSDYKWLLLAIAAVWALSLVLFWLETKTHR
jgi:hypothetical protein